MLILDSDLTIAMTPAYTLTLSSLTRPGQLVCSHLGWATELLSRNSTASASFACYLGQGGGEEGWRAALIIDAL
jgi:hypothetical protein